MITHKTIKKELDGLFPEAKCELNYTKDYELLLATVLSAQCTDKRVNKVTKVLFSEYDIFSLAEAPLKEIEKKIRSLGTSSRKSVYLKEISMHLVKDYNGIVPNNRNYLESLPGVGHKTCNVVLANLFSVPALAVDTHVERVSKRLGLVNKEDNVKEVEKKLMHYFPKKDWIRIHHQFVLFGRYHCKSISPLCSSCPFMKHCKYEKKSDK